MYKVTLNMTNKGCYLMTTYTTNNKEDVEKEMMRVCEKVHTVTYGKRRTTVGNVNLNEISIGDVGIIMIEIEELVKECGE